MDDNLPRRMRAVLTAAVVTLALGLSALGQGCSTGSTSPAPTGATSSSRPAGGLPGAAERAEEVKDQTNERTNELEDQVATYGR